ncbi:MAG: NHLP bacteriocin export ABC transporter permease/ATPase subunit [Deltaproteobacteria bacterium]|nr:NHLP bacteriocin export ABC transporter permease/ATPase subunit [Deltaproteobacteria bacterium]
MTQEDSSIDKRESNERLRLKRKLAAEKRSLGEACLRLTSVLRKKSLGVAVQANPEHPLEAACKIICDFHEIPFKKDHDIAADKLRLVDIAHNSGFRTREVLLTDAWWRRDNGPLLGFLLESKRPVALIPSSVKGYDLCDPVAGSRTPLTAALAETLRPQAQVFYRPFPNRALNGMDLVKMAINDCRQDLVMVLVMGASVALLGLFTPWVTGIIFDTVIPEASRSQLWQIVALLLTCAFVTMLFNLTKGIAIVRVEGKVDGVLQAAVWDRLLALPVPFFKQFTVGDLANRGMGINAIRQILSGIAINAVLTFLFSSFNLVLLFYYDWQLALVALTLLSIGILCTLLISYFQYCYQRQIMDIEGRLAGLVLQFINGIAKLRITATEDRAFFLWAQEFADKKSLSYKSGLVKSGLLSFNVMFPLISLITLFTWVTWKSVDHLTTGDFLAFNAAYVGFQNASLQMAMTISTSLNIFPLYERAKPILQSLPESTESKAHPGVLVGGIEVSHLFFRYSEDGPLILDDISIKVDPGEFIAIVGGSGCGKSTLFRLLLGFETPQSGSILYDNQDLATLEVGALRRQLGVVLQNASLLSGDIFKNIIGSANLTLDDAWEAARMVGLDEDINEMPMKMNTVVPPGGTTLSGGQRQRIIIARAIVNKPRILYFDEATSALDNQTQAITSHSLESLAVSRIVIAHRLSTIIHADRIYVMDKGKLVQSGTYDELMAEPDGMFADMAKRQIA